jgi:hypothetical protein
VSRSDVTLIAYDGIQSVAINGGNGNNTYNVSSTPTCPETLNAGNGHDTVNVDTSSGRFVINEGTGGVDEPKIPVRSSCDRTRRLE